MRNYHLLIFIILIHSFTVHNLYSKNLTMSTDPFSIEEFTTTKDYFKLCEGKNGATIEELENVIDRIREHVIANYYQGIVLWEYVATKNEDRISVEKYFIYRMFKDFHYKKYECSGIEMIGEQFLSYIDIAFAEMVLTDGHLDNDEEQIDFLIDILDSPLTDFIGFEILRVLNRLCSQDCVNESVYVYPQLKEKIDILVPTAILNLDKNALRWIRRFSGFEKYPITYIYGLKTFLFERRNVYSSEVLYVLAQKGRYNNDRIFQEFRDEYNSFIDDIDLELKYRVDIEVIPDIEVLAKWYDATLSQDNPFCFLEEGID